MTQDELDAKRYRWIVSQHQKPKTGRDGEWWRVTIRLPHAYTDKASLDAIIDDLIDKN